MNIKNLDLNLLRVFDVIYRERNLTRASKVLRITQPAVSNALRRLRDSLENPLFQAAPGGMVPTPEAERIIGRVREALNLIESTLNDVSRFDPTQSTKLFKFSMNDFSEALVLPRLTQIIVKGAPLASINTHYVPRDDASRELASGQLDFVLDTVLPVADELFSMPLISESYVCVMRPDSPLAKRKITLDTYLNAKHVHVSSRRYGRGQVDLALDKLGASREITLRVPHYLIAAMVVESTDLLWTVPRALAVNLPLKIRSLPFDAPLMECQLYWHERMDKDPENQWMRLKLKESVAIKKPNGLK